MKISLAIIIGSLVLAILATVLVESRFTRRMSERAASRFMWLAVLCCYGVCIGVVSGLLVCFLHVPEWIALVIAIPLGIPLLLLAAKAGES